MPRNTRSPNLATLMARLSRKQWLLAAGLFLAALIGIGFWTIYRDEPPPDDADILRQPVLVPHAENGIYAIIDLQERLAALESEPFIGTLITEPENPVDIDWVKVSEQFQPLNGVLDEIDHHLNAPIAQPALYDARVDFVGISEEIGLTRLLCWRAQFASQEMRDAELWADVLRVLQIGHNILQGPAVIVDNLVGVSIQSMALELVISNCHSLAPDARTTRQRTDMLKSLQPGPDTIKETLLNEYYLCRTSSHAKMQKHAATSYGIFAPIAYKPNQTARMWLTYVREGMANADRPSTRFAFPHSDAIAARPGSLDNFLGSLFMSPASLLNKNNSLQAYFAVSRVGLALAGYANENNGDLPANLEELVPVYIDAIPADSMDGQPLRYDRERRRVWSIGKDLKDQSGRTWEEYDNLPGPKIGEKAYDIVVEIPQHPHAVSPRSSGG